MSELASIVNAGNSVIPGHVLSEPGIEDIGMAERYCEEAYFAKIAGGAVGLPPTLRDAQLDAAREDIRKGKLAFGTNDFDWWANRTTSAPLLTMLCIRPTNPKITYAEVCKLYNDVRRSGGDKVYRRATLEHFGYNFEPAKNDDAGGAVTTGTNPSLGQSSTQSSSLQPPVDSESAPANSGE